MYQLKTKVQGEDVYTVGKFETLQEVAEQIKTLCEASTLAEVLKVQKEMNIRFYISFKK